MLTPSTTLSACPGDEAVVKCYEPEASANMRIVLRWEITLRDISFSTIELHLSDIDNQSQQLEAGLQFYAELTSYSPLIAILTTTAYPALNGATVTCLIPGTMGTLTIIVHERTGNQFIYFTGSKHIMISLRILIRTT